MHGRRRQPWPRSALLVALLTIFLSGCGAAAQHASRPPSPAKGPRSPRSRAAHLSVEQPLPAVVSSFPDTTDGIHIGLAFDYHAGGNGDALATKVDYIFGGYFADWNFGFYPPVKHIDGYLPFDNDPFPQTVTGHSLADWQAQHPDWIVYQCDRKTPAYYGSGNTNVPLDFSNPAVRAWQMQQAAGMLDKGAAGVAFDDYSFFNYSGRCGVYRNGVWTPLGYPARRQDNARLDSDMLAWLKDMHARMVQQFTTKTLTLSFAPSLSGFSRTEEVAPYIDMDFDEAGFTFWGGRPLSDSSWQQEVNALEYLNAHGKAFDVNGIVRAADDASVSHAELNWVLANYLLVKGLHSYTYVYAGNGSGFTESPSGYGTFYDRSAYHIPIGYPTSARYSSQGVQMRNYSDGLVVVNPSGALTYSVALPSRYTDLWDRPYTVVTLAPTTGIVLLSPKP